jgi:hypothetical protein
MMEAIYTNAYQVLIWLGEKIDRNGTFVSIFKLVQFWARENGVGDMIPLYNHPFKVENKHTSSVDLIQIESLYRSRWFSRVWVLQEVALARSATVFRGQCEIPWEYIGLAAAIIRTNHNHIYSKLEGLPPGALPIGLRNAYFMYRISKSQKLFEPLRFSFHQLLQLTRQFQCKESRDKIFGLLAIPTTDNAARMIVVDYKKSDAEIYHDVTLTLVRVSKSLDVFSSIQGGYERGLSENEYLQPGVKAIYAGDSRDSRWVRPFHSKPLNSDIPSWVPQWDLVYTQTLIPLETDRSSVASSSFIAISKPTSDPLRLSVSGTIVDTAATVTYQGSQIPIRFSPRADSTGKALLCILPQLIHYGACSYQHLHSARHANANRTCY